MAIKKTGCAGVGNDKEEVARVRWAGNRGLSERIHICEKMKEQR
jgi:hypothetical protein